jgi:hypothetical protein
MGQHVGWKRSAATNQKRSEHRRPAAGSHRDRPKILDDGANGVEGELRGNGSVIEVAQADRTANAASAPLVSFVATPTSSLSHFFSTFSTSPTDGRVEPPPTPALPLPISATILASVLGYDAPELSLRKFQPQIILRTAVVQTHFRQRLLRGTNSHCKLASRANEFPLGAEGVAGEKAVPRLPKIDWGRRSSGGEVLLSPLKLIIDSGTPLPPLMNFL